MYSGSFLTHCEVHRTMIRGQLELQALKVEAHLNFLHIMGSNTIIFAVLKV